MQRYVAYSFGSDCFVLAKVITEYTRPLSFESACKTSVKLRALPLSQSSQRSSAIIIVTEVKFQLGKKQSGTMSKHYSTTERASAKSQFKPVH